MTAIVANIFIVIAIGWLFRKYNLVGVGAEKVFNQYLFYLALPSLTVVKIVNTNFSGLSLTFLSLNVLPLLFLMALALLLLKAGLADWKLARLLVIVAALGNTVYLGFPIVAMRLGPQQIGYAAIASSIQNIVIFTFGFYLTNLICAGGGPDGAVRLCSAASFKRLVVHNAVLWSSIAGLFISWLSLPVPAIAMNVMENIGQTTLPLSLFTIGLSLYGKNLGHDFRQVALATALKMLVLPAIYLALALALGFKGTVSKMLFLEYAMPAAVLNFVIAKEFDFDADLVARIIVFSTLALLPLLFVCDLALKLL